MQQETSAPLAGKSLNPDQHARGMLSEPVNALRYSATIPQNIDPWEAAGRLRELVPAGIRLLDIGCGTGSVTNQVIRDKGIEAYGVEPDGDRAARAESAGISVVRGEATRALLAEIGPFDVIMLADVLEHVPAPAELLDIAISGLNPGGKIIASIPNVAHWSVRFSLFFGRFEYTDVGIMDATHLRWFTRRSVRSLFERCGMEVVSIGATAGAKIPEYNSLPWSLIPRRLRRAGVRRLSRLLPTLFALQHIVEARLPRG